MNGRVVETRDRHGAQPGIVRFQIGIVTSGRRLVIIRRGRRVVRDFSNREHRSGVGADIAKAHARQRATGPCGAQGGEAELDAVGGGISFQLLAHVDQGLHRGHVDIGDGGAIQDDGTQVRTGISGHGSSIVVTGRRIVPGTIAQARVAVGIGSLGVGKDVGDQAIGVIVGCGTRVRQFCH